MDGMEPSFNSIFRIVFFVWLSSLVISVAIGVVAGLVYVAWLYNALPILVIAAVITAFVFFLFVLP
jgi:hypothetical protein